MYQKYIEINQNDSIFKHTMGIIYYFYICCQDILFFFLKKENGSNIKITIPKINKIDNTTIAT